MYGGLPHGEIYASPGKSLRPSTRNPAFPRALLKVQFLTELIDSMIIRKFSDTSLVNFRGFHNPAIEGSGIYFIDCL